MRELLCIQTHSQGVVKAGQVYNLISTRSSPCACMSRLIDVGIRGTSPIVSCNKCGAEMRKEQHIYWLDSNLFAEIATQEEVSKKETVEAEG